MTPTEALNRIDMFWCTRYHNPCRISRKSCARRYQTAQRAVKDRLTHVLYAGALTIDLSQCKGCETGKLNAKQYKKPNRSRHKQDNRKKAIPNACKICSKCGQVRHRRSFHRKRANPDGLQRICKFCMKEYRERRKKNGNTH